MAQQNMRRLTSILSLLAGMELAGQSMVIKNTIEPNTDELWRVPKRNGSPYGKKQRRQKQKRKRN